MESAFWIHSIVEQAEAALASAFSCIDQVERTNTKRMLAAFADNQIAQRHFAATSGYGYDDIGRDALDRVYAQAFGCEDALVRPTLASGTHALATCLFGLLRPGDKLLAATGKPYDTLDSVIGLAAAAGSLREWGVDYAQVDLLADGTTDWAGIEAALADRAIRVVLLQRSRGYEWRPSLRVDEIEALCTRIHAARADVWIMVDNCYGEFVETREPVSCGADVMVGSLIKNPGGGLAPTGGYIAGRADLIERIAARVVAPGIGREVGSYAYGYEPFYKGLFLAPHAVNQAVKCSMLAAAVFERLGFEVNPRSTEARSDIIQAIKLGTAQRLIAFCRGVQSASPVDSHLVPEPWDMPGYADPVIMAAGAFVQGASIEWSADAPLRAPYIAYVQGGLTLAHGALGLVAVLERLFEEGLIDRPEGV